MRKTHDLAVVTGTYQKDGQTKKRYQNIGVMLEGDSGPFILLDKTFNPAGIEGRDGRISVSLFAPKAEGGYSGGYGGGSYGGYEPSRKEINSEVRQMRDELDDEIPFD